MLPQCDTIWRCSKNLSENKAIPHPKQYYALSTNNRYLGDNAKLYNAEQDYHKY